MKRSICLAVAGIFTTLNCVAAEPFLKEQTIEATVKVDAIAPESRLISVTAPDGHMSSILAGPEVVNFDQIHVGDQVKMVYKAALAAKLSKSKAKPTETYDSAVYRAPKGAKPAGGVGQSITTTVQIESVDTSFDVVTFKRPDGFLRTISVASPEGKKFIRTLKKGDMVDVEYTEALAVSVVPAK